MLKINTIIYTFAVVTVQDTFPLVAFIIVLNALITPLILVKRLLSAITTMILLFMPRTFAFTKKILSYVSIFLCLEKLA